MNHIAIKVIGPAGSGRTTIAERIHDELSEETYDGHQPLCVVMAADHTDGSIQALVSADERVVVIYDEVPPSILTDRELEWCATHPDILRALADMHEVRATEAEAIGELEGPLESHTKRRDELRALAKQIEDAL